MLPLTGRAQRPRSIPVIGALFPGPPTSAYGDSLETFRQALRGLGLVEGQSYTLEARWSDGRPEDLRALSGDLVSRKVDVILVASGIAARAVATATQDIPVVQVSGADPVGNRLVGSLARPSGNVTGLSARSEELSGKLLEILIEAVPGLARVGALLVPGAPVTAGQLRTLTEAAGRASIAVNPVGFSDSASLASAFSELERQAVDGLVVFSAALTTANGSEIIRLAGRAALPSIYPYRHFVVRGGLMSYGVDPDVFYRSAAQAVVRILRGARPADIPVEMPTRYELVVNNGTAQSLGIVFPPSCSHGPMR